MVKKINRVPVIENAFEVNVAKIMKVARHRAATMLTLSDGFTTALVMVLPDAITFFTGGAAHVVDVVAVACLNGRVRPLLKCPRAHEGNFQALYYQSGDLACRYCHGLRYRSTLAASATARAPRCQNSCRVT
jgi:hypothetical protein